MTHCDILSVVFKTARSRARITIGVVFKTARSRARITIDEMTETNVHGFVKVDEGSGIREKLDSGQTKIMETGAFDEGSGIMEELDGGQTKMMETGEIHRSKPEISRFEPITSEKLKDLLKYFKVEYPEDPFSESFVRQIIQEDMLRKLETAVESLSIGIVLTKNIPLKRHDLSSVEAFVLEVDVVYGGDQFRATIKEDFDDVAKFIAYQMLSSYCTLVESVTIAFTMDLPKMISEHPVEFLTPEKIKHFFSELFEGIEDKDVRSMERNRHWRPWVTGEILKKVMTNGKSICADAWVKIYDVCQKTLQDLYCILSELEEFRTKVLPANQNKPVEEGSAIMEEIDSGQTTIMETGAVEEGSAIMEELDSGQTTIMETGAVDEGSDIREKLASGQTKIMETGAVDEGSGIMEELDGGQTKMMETGEIHRSRPEIFRFEPITSEKLKDLLKYFKVEYPEDPFSESFVRQIIQEDMLRKLETAVESLSKGIVLTKNIPTKRHDLPSVEAFVLEVDVVYDGDQFRATIKDASSNEFFSVNEDNITRVILVKSKSLPVVDAKLIVYKKYKHVISKQKITLRHEYEDFDDVAKFIAYQMLSSYCTFVESVIIAFTMDLPKMLSEHPVEFLTAEKIKHFFLEVFEGIEDKDVRSMDRNRDWRAWVTGEILKKVMTNGESICADAWVKIYDVCQKTLQDLYCILSELEEFRTKVLPANQNKQIEEWLKREVVRDRSVLEKHPTILKYITGYRDSVDKKQVVKVFLNCEDKDSEMIFKKCCDASNDLQFEFVNVERFKEKNKDVEELKLRERKAPAVDNSTRKQLKQIIQDHGEKMYALFSNVVGISIGKARRVGNSIQEEPCIVLYCLDKYLIPFGENPLPESIAGWPCDIREDFVRFGRCPRNCPAQNQSFPDPGCSIGIELDTNSGSAGFLYESREPTNALGDGFFTTAHVAVKGFEKLFPDKSFTTANFCPDDRIIVHPSFSENGNENNRVGRVAEAFFGKHDNIGLDLAVIKINESRNEAEKEILTFAEKDDLKFGEDIVTKTGKTTGTTYGCLTNDSLSIKMEISPRTFEFLNCYAIENINDDDPFILEGDSGSGVYVLKNRQPIKPLGIAFAFLNSQTAVCNISKKVDTLGLQIVRFVGNKDESTSSETLKISEEKSEEKSNEPMGML